MVNLASISYRGYRYNSPWTQVVLVGFVCFCSVGMFSAVSNLGAGGTEDPQLSDTSNAVLYALASITGFFAGSVNNLLGPRLTLSIGSTGYVLYIGALWAFQAHGTRWFLIMAGALLGISSSLLWVAEACVMMSYPMEKDKGRSFTLFWAIFQAGTLVGSVIALGIEAHSTLPAVSTGVYLAFMIITIIAIFASWLILPPSSVVRSDGTIVVLEGSISARQEIAAFIRQFKDWRMVALLPMFFASNYFYAYQGAITTFLFNGRTRALVATLTGLGSIVGSIFVGMILDRLPFSRKKRSMLGCGAVALLNTAVWVGGLVFQLQFTRDTDHIPWDWTQGAAVGPIILLMSYYILDAAFQGLAYYTMSSMSNDPFRLARMAGYYNGIQSAGAAVSFGMDAVKTPYLTEHLVSWVQLLVSLPLCAYVLYRNHESSYEVETAYHVEDVKARDLHGAALPSGHHAGSVQEKVAAGEHEKASSKDLAVERTAVLEA